MTVCIVGQGHTTKAAAHYAHIPMQYAEIFKGSKMLFLDDFFYFFLICAQNIDCGYTLEPPQ